MSWPLSQDYNEVIQDPANSFGDAELKTGEAVTNPLGIPLPRSGNFADVYEVRCPSGSRWAVKCFTREVSGLRERYNEISKYLHQVNLPFMVDFQYQEQGIRVRGQWYPILKMQWVEGFVLNEFVRDNLDKKPILQAMGQIWLRMARRLREANLAHCDLQHGNVLLVPGSTANSLAVKLIDYDGMCVPALAGTKSGEVGHPAFQHPERLRTGAYNQEVDRFSLLAIATSLRCLTVGGRALWERYDNGDNLLFRQADLQAPTELPVFKELLAIGDPQAQGLVKELYRACQGPLNKVPLLTDLWPEEKLAGKVTTAPTASSSALAKRPAAAQGLDWDFNEEEGGNSVVKKRRAKGGMPGWVWGAVAGAAALLLLGVGVGFGLVMRKGQDDKEGTPLAHHQPNTKTPKPTPKPPTLVNQQQPSNPSNPPLNPRQQPNLIWDKPIDPDGDCKFKNVGGKLTIAVPDKPHALETDNDRANSPRMLFDVEGDFTVQVRVGGDFVPATTSTLGQNSWIGAGLLLWVDDNTFLRLERAGWHGRTPSTLYANWEVRQDGKARDLKHNFPSLDGTETYLRLERRGNMVLAAFSDDGRQWNNMTPLDIELPAKVKIGFLADSTSASTFAPTFDRFKLKKGQGQMFRVNLPLSKATMPVVVNPPTPAEQKTFAWDKRIDPSGDCKFQEVEGKLTITLPNGMHNLAVEQGPMTAPRLLGDVTGDFTVQVRVSDELGKDSQNKGFFWMGAGLLLWSDEKNYLLVQRALGAGRELFLNWESRKGGRKDQKPDGHPALTGMDTYLRLERRGDKFIASHSKDGKTWTEQTPIELSLPEKVKIGVTAIALNRSFTASFDQFQFKQGQGDMVRVEKWLAPGETVVVKPPKPKPPTRRNRRQLVPDAAAVEAAVKNLRARYKDEYGGDRNKLRMALFNELNAVRNDPPQHFAVLRELRDIAAERNLRGGSSQVQWMAQSFEVNLLEMKCDALEKSLRSARPSASDIIEVGLPLLDQAVGEENYDVIARLMKPLRLSAGNLPGTDPKRPMAAYVLGQADNALQEHKKLQPVLRTLETTPEDAKANLAVGKFHCVARGDWEEGLPLLALGSDAALKALAQKDLDNPADAVAQTALGDAWRKEAGAVSTKSMRIACQKRAYSWYEQAAAQLKGAKLASVKSSLKALAKVPELQNPWWQFGIYAGATPDLMSGSLSIRPPNGMRTRQYYRGAIDITVVARSMPTDLNISIGGGGRLVIGRNFAGKGDHLLVFRPDGVPESVGSRADEKAVTLPASRWFTVRWQVTSAGMTVWLDGEILFEETHDYDLSGKYPVQVHCGAATIEVKSVLVRRGPEK